MSVKVKERSGQWGMSSVFRKNSKPSAVFWTLIGGKKFGEKWHSTPLN